MGHILPVVLVVFVYLIIGIWAEITTFEKMGLRSVWGVLIWPCLFLGVTIAMMIAIAEDTLTDILGMARKTRDKWRKKK